jgi:tetratricopeptide (TPR) repeat protein
MRSASWLTAILASLFLIGCQTTPVNDNSATDYNATDYYRSGMSAYSAGNYDQAISDFQQATYLDPRYGDAFYGLGKAYEAIHRDQQALEAYLSAVRAQPSHGEAHSKAGILYFKQRKYDPAETHLKRAISYAPADPMSFYYLGEIYRMQGKCKSSVDMYKKALAISPNLLDAKDGLRRAQREVCGGSTRTNTSTSTSSRTPVRKPKPTYEKVSDFTGGGKALTPDQW